MRRPGVEQLHALLRGAVPGPRAQAAHQYELRAGEQAVQGPWQPTIFETRSPRFRPARSRLQGKIFTLDRDASGDGRIDIDVLRWDYLEGDGDFRSAEVTALRDAADIIVTNPPFPLFREFLAWAVNDACAGVLIQGEGVRGSCGLWGTSCFRFANRL